MRDYCASPDFDQDVFKTRIAALLRFRRTLENEAREINDIYELEGRHV